ncbi:hypothetical protein O6P43_020461 [Quillaja saponaria]|uniref:Uncharacterized protein n=1 Tax=Quillaja saponaria TaxID=32244 RepID=A0AAD7LKP7_QUISA|nr:hypothetical protein O6P43_020461 [Quillaja saponaria]
MQEKAVVEEEKPSSAQKTTGIEIDEIFDGKKRKKSEPTNIEKLNEDAMLEVPHSAHLIALVASDDTCRTFCEHLIHCSAETSDIVLVICSFGRYEYDYL